RILCSCTLQYLRSFPTRRSSDLVALAVYFGELIEQVDVALVYFELRIFVRQPMKGRAGAREYIELCPPKILEGCAGFGRRCSCPDRKSTRLNSSHQIISYAVFCL